MRLVILVALLLLAQIDLLASLGGLGLNIVEPEVIQVVLNVEMVIRPLLLWIFSFLLCLH